LKAIGRVLSSRAAVVADHGLYSSTNLLVGLSVARAADLATFGVYALTFQIVNFTLVMARATIGETRLVEGESPIPGGAKGPMASSAFAFAAGVGLVPVLLAGTAVARPDGDWTVMPATILALPALLAQDSQRFACFAAGKPSRALLSDGFWLLTQLLLLVGMRVGILPFSAAWAALAWAIGAYAGLLTIGGSGIFSAGSIIAGFRWWRRHLPVGRHLAAETLGSSMVGPLVAISLVSMNHEVTLGVLRGASTLFGPILVFAQAMRTALTKRAGPEEIEGLGATRMLMMAACAFWGVVLALAPDVGAFVLGGLWGPSIAKIVLLEAAARIGLASVAVDSALLRRSSATSTAAALGVTSGGLVVGMVLIGTLVAGFVGAATGAATAYLTAALAWRRLCRRLESSAIQAGFTS
jgi:hypothetical protein